MGWEGRRQTQESLAPFTSQLGDEGPGGGVSIELLFETTACVGVALEVGKHSRFLISTLWTVSPADRRCPTGPQLACSPIHLCIYLLVFKNASSSLGRSLRGGGRGTLCEERASSTSEKGNKTTGWKAEVEKMLTDLLLGLSHAVFCCAVFPVLALYSQIILDLPKMLQ